MVKFDQSAKQAVGQRVSEHAQAGLDLLERKAVNAGQLAEHTLGEHGVAPGQLGETIAANIDAARHELAKGTRRSRKKLAKNARRARKKLARATKDTTKQARLAAELAGQSGQKIAGDLVTQIELRANRAGTQAVHTARQHSRELSSHERRRWPWILGGLAVVAAAAAGCAAWNRSALADSPADALNVPGDVGPSPESGTADSARSSAPTSDSTGPRPRAETTDSSSVGH